MFLCPLLLGIGASVTKALITIGANLLSQEATPVMNWFRREMSRSKEQLLEKRPPSFPKSALGVSPRKI